MRCYFVLLLFSIFINGYNQSDSVNTLKETSEMINEEISVIKEGDKAPNFSGVDQNGDTISLADFKGKTLIVYFYPKDNTPGCTMQACNLRDNYQLLLEKGYAIVGVSADTEKKHQGFIEKYDLPFPLIADTEKVMINQFGVWGRKKFMGKEYDGIFRKTFIINEEGIIIKIFEKVKTKQHTEQILEELEK